MCYPDKLGCSFLRWIFDQFCPWLQAPIEQLTWSQVGCHAITIQKSEYVSKSEIFLLANSYSIRTTYFVFVHCCCKFMHKTHVCLFQWRRVRKFEPLNPSLLATSSHGGFDCTISKCFMTLLGFWDCCIRCVSCAFTIRPKSGTPGTQVGGCKI